MSVLYIFNPETDYALAVGEGPYTPPAHVVEIKRKMALLPTVYAAHEGLILVPDDFFIETEQNHEFLEFLELKSLRVIKETDVINFIEDITAVKPWGWNYNLRRLLLSANLPENLVPTILELDNLKRLAHRRTCIPFRESLASLLDIENLNPGEELFSIEDVKSFLQRYPYSYFKAPWSSSGRGVVSTTHISLNGLLEWAQGSINRQGSVIAEPGWNRTLDFATEWNCENGEATFLGLSVFKTSSRGKYKGNIRAGQKELNRMISEATENWRPEIIEAQKDVLRNMIAREYAGPVGIDMLIDSDRKINLCVEINLRLTMGHIEIYRESCQ